MHKIQQALLQHVDSHNLGALTLREIGDLVGEKYPQKIKHHLGALEKKGFIRIDKNKSIIERRTPGKIRKTSLVSLPILGTANCGPATFYADANVEGHLKVSSKILTKQTGVYAIKADGLSMNKASVKGNLIDDGDYLIVDSSDTNPIDGDIVVSVFDDVANVKRFRWDAENNRVVLVSESSHDFPPIFIHEDDDYHVVGKVVQVIKKPSF